MTVDQTIIAKIQKMLDMADPSKNDNAHQVEVAMRKAQEFMRAHGLSMADVAAASPDKQLDIHVAVWRDEEKSQYDTWVKLLAQATAALMGCRCIIYRSGPGNRYRCSMAFIGEETDVTIAKSVWPWLVKHGRVAARRAVDGGWCAEHRSFVEAFACRVLQRAEKMAAAAHQPESEEDQRYLMVLDAKENAIQLHMDEMFPNLRHRKSSFKGEYDPASAALGAAEGDRVNLQFRQQLGEGSERKLLN